MTELAEALVAKQIIDKYNSEHQHQSQTEQTIIDLADNTDVGNAKRMVAMYGNQIRYCHPWKSWLCWNGKYWERDQTGQIYRYAKETADKMMAQAEQIPGDLHDKLFKHAVASKSLSKLKAMVTLAESELSVTVLPHELDHDKMLLTVQNGTIDLRTGILRPHNHNDYITKMSPATFDEKATCSLWDEFMNTIMREDRDLIKYLQKLAGQTLTGEVREKRLYILYGKKDTGKTTFVETIAHILAEYAETMPIESLMKNSRGGIPNDIAALKGKRFVFVDEPDFGDRLSEGLIKKLTGQDTINARFLNEEFFRFKPEFKLVISTNNQPDITDKDQAIWGRVKCIPFLAKIPPEQQDNKLHTKLTTDDNMSGILNWMIQGCLEWQHNGMTEPIAVRKASEEMKEDMDTLSDFFNICCIKGNEYRIPHEYLYTAFRLWAGAVGRQPMSKKAFTQVCINRDFDRTDTIFIGQRRMRGFIGITCTDWMIEAITKYLNYPQDLNQITKDVINYCFKSVQPVQPVQHGTDVTKSVHEKNALPDNEKNATCTDNTDLTQVSVRFLGGVHVCEDIMCSMRSNCSCITNMCLLPVPLSVQSVQSVQYKDSIVSKIKEKYDNLNKPESIELLNRLADNIELFILNEVPGAEQVDVMRIIHDYFKVRGWE